MNAEQEASGEDGGRGESTFLTPVQENKIISLMLHDGKRWGIDITGKVWAIKTTLRNMQVEDGRVSNGAVANYIKMEAMNQKDEETAKGVTPGATYIQNNTTINTLSVALAEPEYLDFLRSRALEADSKPSPVCENGERGPMENGQALNGHRPGTNGCNGNGKREDYP